MRSAFTAVIALVILLALHWPLTLATIAFMGLFSFVLARAMKKRFGSSGERMLTWP